jgi:predicted unusual protein kinase regulating ubiquinone biosynthesis (AarF/ABC1/UbiB family)
VKAFEAEMCDVFDKMRVVNSMGKSAEDAIGRCLDTVRRHQLHVSSELLSVVTSSMVLEGWASSMHPELNVMGVLKDLLDKAELLQERILDYVGGHDFS